MDKESTKWIRFLGGKNLLYTLTILCLIAVTIFLFNTVSFIFKPIFVIFSAVLGPVLFGIILFYLLNPMVKRLEKKIPRVWAIAILYVLIIALLVLAGLQLFPIIQDQTEELIKQFPSFWKSTLQAVQEFMAKTPFAKDLESANESINQLWGKLANSFKDFTGDYLQTGAQGLGSVFSAVSSTFLTLFTGPIIAFFLLKDKEKFYRFVKGIIPPAFRPDFDEYSQIANIQIGDYLKGQVIASLVLGIMYWPAFLLIGLQFGSILALAAGILCIIPYIGPFIAFIPGLIIAFQDSTFMVVKFVIVWFAIQLIHGDFVIPRVMGDKLKVHPITILLVLLVMGELFGLMGVIFGIPMYCLVKVTVIYLFRKFKQRYNRFYGDNGEYEHTNFTKDQYLK
ncbi:AI-2E family transporter [Enterococcus faecalis]|uniref:AI-2E family transporter n=1 Tax=Enterococcus faecalis TaxID=1351 RepID=UPI001C5B7BC7|nr:AI-2E family transporter [Enterococcus faecalis]MBW4168452.1 AI-2E family transporter [Enterococcus faecalis]MBW4173425.1 AI-2E family transporter [Enterococcus faecalis]MBW4176314.1 AI-2E family transporter [Enterococcus faecalis]MCD4999788.1 AI-2E family transporter [Enterococcus faecalis]MCD5267646.1 AI-2E family transporter [Enterococcus faecalis]